MTATTGSLNKARKDDDIDVDVVVVGAGIIGLSLCHAILSRTDLSVAIVDKERPCAGATGAGQGYIWMGHRTPGTSGWSLAERGKSLWEDLIQEIHGGTSDDPNTFGWMNTGSLLVGQSEEEAKALRIRAQALSVAGVQADFLSAGDAISLEPSLSMSSHGGALLVPNDSQIDAGMAVDGLVKFCKDLGGKEGKSRYIQLFGQPVQSLIRSDSNRVVGLETSHGRINASRAVVMAAGAWTAPLVASFQLASPCVPPVKPRKGHLLVVEGFPEVTVNRALMEAEYTANYANSPASMSASVQPSVSMTVTRDHAGRLLIGSSRAWSGFNSSVDLRAIQFMLRRAEQFLPSLSSVRHSLAAMDEAGITIRTGLRPYSMDGRPTIGPVPGYQNLYLSCGHEGSGLCMALSSAELLLDIILENKPVLDPAPFLPEGRLLAHAP